MENLKIVLLLHFYQPWWEPKFMKIGARKAMEIIDCFGSTDDRREAKKIFKKLDDLK